MVRAIKVSKQNQSVTLSFDDEGLFIHNGLIKSKSTNMLFGCIPIATNKTGPDLTRLPIDNMYILNAYYQQTTRTIYIDCVLPRDRNQPQSLSDRHCFSYLVHPDQQQEAIDFCNEFVAQVYKDIKPQKRLLVLVNPFSGQKKAKEIFEYSVRPVFELAKCAVEVKYTERQGHALQIAQELDINAYDAVVTVSGDGIVHEVINGFLSRSDEPMKKISIGVIPGGTSNSLSISLLGETRGFDPVYAALQVIKGKPMAIDVCSIEFDDHRYYSFLLQNFGIAAYADLGTDHLRWMGDARTMIGILQQVFTCQSYQTRVSMQVVQADKKEIQASYDAALLNPSHVTVDSLVTSNIPKLSEPVPEDWMVLEDDVTVLLASKVPILNRGMQSHPYALPNDGTLDMMIVRNNLSIPAELGILLNVANGQHVFNENVRYYKVKAFRLEPIVKQGQKVYLAIDGENAPCKPFQVEVLPRLASVLTIKPSYQRVLIPPKL